MPDFRAHILVSEYCTLQARNPSGFVLMAEPNSMPRLCSLLFTSSESPLDRENLKSQGSRRASCWLMFLTCRAFTGWRLLPGACS